jgi:uncharacterized membrane protein SirB2
MQSLLIYSNLGIGAFLVIVALLCSTANWQSSFFFKVIPFFSGAVLIFNGLKLLSII